MRICLYLIILVALVMNGCIQNASRPDKRDQLSDEQLLDTLQYHTFLYFWEGAEPNSGLARERYHVDGIYPQNDKHIVTTGGGGFGLMAILAGIERGFISRRQGFERFSQIVGFLETADRYHGVWPHWLNGKTGKVQPFSKFDDGGDLVETAFLMQGLITVMEYFRAGNEQEQELAGRINKLWREVEWDWHTREGEKVLYWHWSPNVGWQMNHKITGYNECLITYVLAAASPTHPIDRETYEQGWALGGAIAADITTHGHRLRLRHHVDSINGGPLFWAHYSYLGLDPRGLTDHYADYLELNRSHTLINRQHCIDNPHGYKGYGVNCWGLTSSYSVPGAANFFHGREQQKPQPGNSLHTGYAGHRPTFDLGVISPTAALSSLPYAPELVMPVLRHFYENLGDSIWGKFGPYDAFSEEYQWYPQRYLAIDQGPISVMVENYRTGLLWNLFMQNEDVQKGLKKLGFDSPHIQ